MNRHYAYSIERCSLDRVKKQMTKIYLNDQHAMQS